MTPKHPVHRPQPARQGTNPKPRRLDVQHASSRDERSEGGYNDAEHVRDDELILEPESDEERPSVPPLPKDTWRPPRARAIDPVTPTRRPEREIIREGDVLLGRYRVRRVATHGLVTTAEVVHMELGNRAQVQLLLERTSAFAQVQDHFIRSARSLMKMHSRHLARVLDAGTLDSGVPYLVTQWVGSMDLGRYLREQGTLPMHTAIDHVLQICEALAEAHSLGVIHGSIQPANIRLSTGIDGRQTATLYGFGVLGQWMLSSETGASRFASDPHVLRAVQYLSPEQIRQPDAIDELTDLWSIGALLHELLVAVPPFQAQTVTALLAKIVADPAPNLADLCEGLPRELEAIVARCLSKDHVARFPSIAELARALQPFASDESTALVERIVRVAARRATATVATRSNSQALVHVPRRQPRAHPQDGWSMTSPRAEMPNAAQAPTIAMRWYFGAAACAVVAVGALAGVGGAYVAARVVREGTSTTAVYPSRTE
ncbi:MAG TPA: serine/threonine-protein kinase, partial [Polyangiaceae bacterium]